MQASQPGQLHHIDVLAFYHCPDLARVRAERREPSSLNAQVWRSSRTMQRPRDHAHAADGQALNCITGRIGEQYERVEAPLTQWSGQLESLVVRSAKDGERTDDEDVDHA